MIWIWSLSKFRREHDYIRSVEPSWARGQKFYWAFRVALHPAIRSWYLRHHIYRFDPFNWLIK